MEENKLVLTKGGNIFKYQNLEYTEDQKKLLNYIANEVQEFRQKKLFSRIVKVSGFAGTGKHQPYESIIYTPDRGKVTLRDIKVGDFVFTKTGKATRVLNVYPKRMKAYKVTFCDGSTVECCNEHLWEVQSNKQRQTGNYSVFSLERLVKDKKFHVSDKVGYKYSVDLCQAVEFLPINVPLNPYIVGLFLSNGSISMRTIRITMHRNVVDETFKLVKSLLPENISNDISIDNFSSNDLSNDAVHINFKSSIIPILKEIGIYGDKSIDKSIPLNYLYNAVDSRILLLQGLMDGDGSIEVYTNKKKVRYSTSSELLANDVLELVRSLGGYITLNKFDRTKDDKGIEFSLNIRTPFNPFNISIKWNKFEEVGYTFHFKKKFVKVEYIGEKDGACIRVEDESHLYLTDSYTVTHNTTLMTNIFNYGREFGSFSGIIILAPTNKAKVVLQSKVPIKEEFFSTIHSFVYGSPDEEGNWIVKTDVKNYFVLVDESSMISGDVYEDVVKTFINSLIVFIGDGFQLEPVGKDIKLLQKPDVLLTEVKRNSGDILDYSIKIRESNKFAPYNEFSTIESISSFKAIDLYVEDIKNNEDVIYIVADNKTRITANIKCRNRLFPNVTNPVIGDRFISIANSKIFSNGETFIAQELEFIREKTVIFTDYYENEFTERVAVCLINGNLCLVMIDTSKPSRIHKEFSYLDLDVLTDLVGSVNIEWDETGRRYSLKREVVICTYGYAIVCHKAQGSQWNKVYVQPPNYKPKWDEARWIYTAITRAISKLIMVK